MLIKVQTCEQDALDRLEHRFAVRNAIIVCRCSLFGYQRVLAEQFLLKKKNEL